MPLWLGQMWQSDGVDAEKDVITNTNLISLLPIRTWKAFVLIFLKFGPTCQHYFHIFCTEFYQNQVVNVEFSTLWLSLCWFSQNSQSCTMLNSKCGKYMQNFIYTLKWSMPFTAPVFMNLIPAVHLSVQNTCIAFHEIQQMS